MTTITLSNSTIQSAERYAKLHNISVADAIEKGVALLLGKLRTPKNAAKTADFTDALEYVKGIKAKGGNPVPADENSMETLIEGKYYKP